MADTVVVRLVGRAEDNGLAVMLRDLVVQNIEGKPHKKPDFDRLDGTVAIVADDAEVALTLVFRRGELVIHDGILGVPDVTVRGGSDMILALSSMPLTRRLGLPVPHDKAELDTLRSMFTELRAGRFHLYGGLFHLPLLMRLTKVMSING